jgi:hypothetical protein
MTKGKTDVYYGIDKLPEGQRRPTMIESVVNRQVRYHGMRKIDPTLLRSKITKLNRQKELEKQFTAKKDQYTMYINKFKRINISDVERQNARINALEAHKELIALKNQIEAEKKKEQKAEYSIVPIVPKLPMKRGRKKKTPKPKAPKVKAPRAPRPKKQNPSEVSKKYKKK